MAVWNRVIDSDDDTFVLWESDGATLNAVHPLDYPKLREHVPDDFDIVWLKPDDHSNGQLIKRFPELRNHLPGRSAWLRGWS